MGNLVLKDVVRREFEDLKSDLNQGNVPKVAAQYQKQLNEMMNLPLNIAITGNTGVGKSSFVNAFRGVSDDDEEAAEIGTETEEQKAYPHPSFPNIKIWDLPGIGTLKVKAAKYLKKVQFETYDVFIMVISDRFTENDAMLAKEIQRMKKKFYYVRSRIDVTISSEKRKRNFNEEDTLASIRRYCEDRLGEAVGVSSDVFLISSRELHMYDFPLLQGRIAAELPDHKKDILTLSVHIFSENKLMRKKEVMRSYIKKVALISCACGAVPVPGLSMACDVGILIDVLRRFCKVFGLDDRSLRFLALQTGKEFEELRSAIKKTPLANKIDAEVVFSLLTKSSLWVTISLVEMALDIIPLIGSVFGGASSYIVMYYFLNSFLEDAVEDGRNVRAKLLQQPESQDNQHTTKSTMGNIFSKYDVRREFEDLKSDLNRGKIPEEAAEYRGYLNEVQNLPLNIAVVGRAGAGKSSFINAFRGINDDDDDEAAEVGRVEETKVLKPYPHPSFPNITLWELPEIRSRNSKAAEYFEKLQFERYDAFIMIVTDRFTENDAFLATEIQRMRKKFYYVRSKMDLSIEGERRKRNFNMEKTLETIRNYCEDNLKESAGLPTRVFLVSNLHTHMYEFPRLRETMVAELPDYKKHILTQAGQLFSENNLMDKKIKMKPYINKFAMVSCICGAVPVVGLSLVCDIVILMVALRCFRNVFGLDQSSLRFLALQTGKRCEELRSEIQKRPLVSTVNAQLVLSLLVKSVLWVMPLPVKYLGMVFGGGSSFACTYYFLNKFLDNAVEDGQKVRPKFL